MGLPAGFPALLSLLRPRCPPCRAYSRVRQKTPSAAVSRTRSPIRRRYPGPQTFLVCRGLPPPLFLSTPLPSSLSARLPYATSSVTFVHLRVAYGFSPKLFCPWLPPLLLRQ